MSTWLVLFIKQKRKLVVIRNEVAWFHYKKKTLDRWYLIRKSNISNDFVILKETYARTKRAHCVKFSTHIYIKSTVVWFFYTKIIRTQVVLLNGVLVCMTQPKPWTRPTSQHTEPKTVRIATFVCRYKFLLIILCVCCCERANTKFHWINIGHYILWLLFLKIFSFTIHLQKKSFAIFVRYMFVCYIQIHMFSELFFFFFELIESC